MNAVTFSALAFTCSVRFRKRGTSFLSKPFRSGLASHSSSAFCSFSKPLSSSASDFLTRSSASVARASISLAAMLSFSLDKGLPVVSACPMRCSDAMISWLASSMIFCTSLLCSSSLRWRSASSARFSRALTSDLAMETFRCMAWNFSKVIGSRIRMILSRTTSVGSKPSNSAFEKATTSARLSLPSLSVSCFSKLALRSLSFFSAAPLRLALSRVEDTVLKSLSSCLFPSRSFLLRSSISRRDLRAASPSPMSLHLVSRDLRWSSMADLEA
mmetsp:Transcript_14035/g.31795  ORF Transcript_14035/g.31795 Transcript_14035/m.31795 type:complete len:272 (+) Transcript_14035:824-1639(+)